LVAIHVLKQLNFNECERKVHYSVSEQKLKEFTKQFDQAKKRVERFLLDDLKKISGDFELDKGKNKMQLRMFVEHMESKLASDKFKLALVDQLIQWMKHSELNKREIAKTVQIGYMVGYMEMEPVCGLKYLEELVKGPFGLNYLCRYGELHHLLHFVFKASYTDRRAGVMLHNFLVAVWNDQEERLWSRDFVARWCSFMVSVRNHSSDGFGDPYMAILIETERLLFLPEMRKQGNGPILRSVGKVMLECMKSKCSWEDCSKSFALWAVEEFGITRKEYDQYRYCGQRAEIPSKQDILNNAKEFQEGK